MPLEPAGRKVHPVSTMKEAPKLFLSDRTIELALALTATMFGLSKQTVTTIVQVGLPLVVKMAETHPELLQRIYAASLTPLPDSVEGLYLRMVESRALRQALMDDYRATYGTTLDAVNRAAAREAGTTDGQARDVLAAMLPAITQALGRANVEGSEQGFAKGLKDQLI